MATCSEVNANAQSKSSLSETQSQEITVNFGLFFDGTNNNRAQVMMGRLHREQEAYKNISEDGRIDINNVIKYTKLNDSNNEILSEMALDKMSKKEKRKIEQSYNKAETKREILKQRSKWKGGMPRGFMQKVGFTNIALLERFYHPDNSRKESYAFKIYVSGSGTSANVSKGINIAGLATGQGSTGVVQKVLDALDAISDKIKGISANENIKHVHYVFYVFGFSRGATEARLFIDLCSIRDGRSPSLKKQIKKYNKKLSKQKRDDKLSFPKEVDCQFYMGLFDTVSSVGVIREPQWNPIAALTTDIEIISKTASTYHDENVKDLGLDTLITNENVKKVIHICALDEYRENFALCAFPKGKEWEKRITQFFIPGIHTDIGGSEVNKEGFELSGYRDELSIPLKYKEKHTKKTDCVQTQGSQYYYTKKRLKIPRVAVLRECYDMTIETLELLGWLKDGSNMPNEMKRDKYSKEKPDPDSLAVERYSLFGYSNLSLVMMSEFHEKIFSNDLIKGKHSIPKDLPQNFKDMRNKWKGCESNYGKCYFPTDEKDYRDLRIRYLHFSSDAGIVNGPNFDINYCYRRGIYTSKGKGIDTLHSIN